MKATSTCVGESYVQLFRQGFAPGWSLGATTCNYVSEWALPLAG